MNDSLTQRATAWVRNEKPSMHSIIKAHNAMKNKMQLEPAIDQDDGDGALNVLVEAYETLGGDPDDLIHSGVPAVPLAQDRKEPIALLNCGLLVAYDEAHQNPLSTVEKLAVFAELKKTIGVATQGASS